MSKQDYRQLLQPHIINSISGLSLIARVVVDGFLSGLHTSKRIGQGLEFSQYRGYEPGDDPRLLDWKVLARSGRYYVKQAVIDSHITVKFIVDASNSMAHSEKGLSKMEYARVLLAALGGLAQRQGDSLGLFAMNDSQVQVLQPKANANQYRQFLHQLIQVAPQGVWPPNNHTAALASTGQRELLFFVTDLYQQHQELVQWIKRLKSVRNEVVVLHLMGQEESEFSYKGQLIFEDLETGEQRKVHANEAREAYIQNLQTGMATLKKSLMGHQIDYVPLRMDEPISEALQAFLKNRNRLN